MAANDSSEPFYLSSIQVSVSLTLDPKKLSDQDKDLLHLKEDLSKVAEVSYRKGDAIVSLICNVNKTSEILQRVRVGHLPARQGFTA